MSEFSRNNTYSETPGVSISFYELRLPLLDTGGLVFSKRTKRSLGLNAREDPRGAAGSPDVRDHTDLGVLAGDDKQTTSPQDGFPAWCVMEELRIT